jgi:plasmid maintenance system killer protein
MMDYTIDEWAEKVIGVRLGVLTLSDYTLVESEIAYTIYCNNKILYTLNKKEYIYLKERFQIQLKTQWKLFFYFDENEKIFIFEVIENKDKVDYSFQQLSQKKVGYVLFDLYSIQVNEEEVHIQQFSGSYRMPNLIACKTSLYEWITKASEDRIPYLLHPENYKLFRHYDDVLKKQTLLELSGS